MIGKNNIAKGLAKMLNYKFINLAEFFKENNCKDEAEKVN